MIKFQHTIGEIIQHLLIANGLGVDPDILPLGSWPVYSPTLPTNPDNLIVSVTRTGKTHGRTQVDGEVLQHYGFQLMIRAVDDRTGDRKAADIRHQMQVGMYQTIVTINSVRYLIPCISNIGEVLSLGIDHPNSKRSLFSLNALSAIRPL